MKNLAIIIFLLISVSVYAQTFEGKISYQNKYTSRMKDPNSEQLAALMGTTQEYYIKDGNYKTVTNGTLAQWQLYNNKENKLFYKMSNSADIIWSDGSVNEDTVIKIEKNKNAEIILGYSCDELILYTKGGAQKYYYNAKLSINPALFANHKYGNWYAYVKSAKAIPLKIVITNSQFTLENVATEIKKMKLEDNLFRLPENVTLKKATF